MNSTAHVVRAATTPPKSQEIRDRVEDALRTFLDSRSLIFTDAHDIDSVLGTIRSFVLDGGKRIRPLLCCSGWAGAGGGDDPGIFSAAAALELLHASALIHDDIIDASDLRRGKPTVHRRLAAAHREAGWRGSSEFFGVSAAILLGQLCLMWSDELFQDSGLSPAAIRRAVPSWHAMRTEISQGQYLDLKAQSLDFVDVSEAMRVIRYKTANYTVVNPLRIGGLLAGSGSAVLDSYHAFGVPLGEAFQLRDDVIGTFGDSTVSGKSAIDDLRGGKATVLAAWTRELVAMPDRSTFDDLYGNPDLDDEGAEVVRAIIRECGALAMVEEMIEERVARAHSVLASAPIAVETRSLLVEIAGAVANRER